MTDRLKSALERLEAAHRARLASLPPRASMPSPPAVPDVEEVNPPSAATTTDNEPVTSFPLDSEETKAINQETLDGGETPLGSSPNSGKGSDIQGISEKNSLRQQIVQPPSPPSSSKEFTADPTEPPNETGHGFWRRLLQRLGIGN